MTSRSDEERQAPRSTGTLRASLPPGTTSITVGFSQALGEAMREATSSVDGFGQALTELGRAFAGHRAFEGRREAFVPRGGAFVQRRPVDPEAFVPRAQRTRAIALDAFTRSE